MTKGEIRKARQAARAGGQPLTGELALTGEPTPAYAPVRTVAQERTHDRRMHRWAARYDALSGAPEGDGDR